MTCFLDLRILFSTRENIKFLPGGRLCFQCMADIGRDKMKLLLPFGCIFLAMGFFISLDNRKVCNVRTRKI